jgi:hypothetical protein
VIRRNLFVWRVFPGRQCCGPGFRLLDWFGQWVVLRKYDGLTRETFSAVNQFVRCSNLAINRLYTQFNDDSLCEGAAMESVDSPCCAVASMLNFGWSHSARFVHAAIDEK